MMRNGWMQTGALLLALLAAGRSAAEEKTSPLAQVPGKSPLVIYVRGLEGTRERLLTMVKNAVPDLAPKVEAQINETIDKLLEGRAVKGLPKDGACFFVLSQLPVPGAAPRIVFFAQVDSYTTFRDGLLKPEERKALKKDAAGYEVAPVNDHEIYFVERKGYAAFTKEKDEAVALTKDQPGLDSVVAPALAKRLLAADLAVYVNMTAINKTYGDQIKEFRKQFEATLEQSSATLPETQKPNVEIIRRLFGPIFQGIEDSQAFLLTAEFRPDGLGIHAGLGIAKDTKTSKILGDFKSSAMTELNRLPAGAMGYVGMEMDSALFQRFMPLVYGLMVDLDKPEGKAFKEALQEMADAGPHTTTMSIRMPMQGVAIAEYTNPDKAADAQLKLYKALQGGTQFQGAALKSPPKVEANAETYRGFKFHHVSMTWDFEKSFSASGTSLPEENRKRLAAAMKEMMGEGVNSWFGSNGKVLVTVTAPDWPAAKKLLEAYLDGKETAGTTKAFEEVRKHLPGEAVLIYLLDVPQFGALMLKAFMATLPPGSATPGLTPPSGKSTYLGIAITAKPEHVGFDLWVPVTLVSEVRQMIEPLLKSAPK